MDMRVTLDVFLEKAQGELGVDAAAVLLLKHPAKELEYAGGIGFRTQALRHTKIPLGEGAAGKAALERSVVRMDDLQRNPGSFARAPLLLLEGFQTYFAVPFIAKGQVKGVLEIFHRGNLDPDQEWMDFLETLAGQVAIAIDNMSLLEDLHRSNVELALAYDTTLEGWSKALELRDRETQGHTMRVADHAVRLARAAGIAEREIIHVRRGSLLHDIGKMGIPDSILLKPGPLNQEEWAIMRKHTEYAYHLLSPIDFLRPVMDIPYCHHEWWDGTGYPRGLKGEEIPLAARVFAVVDAWDALSHERPYREAWPPERVAEHLREESGTHFDPRIVALFLDMLAEDGKRRR
jgi:HD-GYP domain-containing protein (c-di-GMP phosphodiesterase class II)